MKYIISLIVLIMMVTSTMGTLKAQDIPACPQGWNSGSFSKLVQVDENTFCDAWIWYCWRDINGQREIYVRGVQFLYNNCITGHILDAEFWDLITKYILQFEANLQSSNPEKLNTGPCPYGTIIVDVTRKACWKFITGTYDVTLVGCEEIEFDCEETFTVCWDYNANYEPYLTIIHTHTNPVSVQCGTQPYYNPEILESDCFTNCYD